MCTPVAPLFRLIPLSIYICLLGRARTVVCFHYDVEELSTSQRVALNAPHLGGVYNAETLRSTVAVALAPNLEDMVAINNLSLGRTPVAKWNPGCKGNAFYVNFVQIDFFNPKNQSLKN